MKYNDFRQKVQSLPLFSTSQLGAITNKPSTLRVQLTHWKKQGLVHALRRGLYVLGKAERRVEPSRFYLANQLFIPSYVSLESALAYYGLIPEFVAAATSVTTRKTSRFENEFGLFTYQHVRPEGFDGFEAIAETEKFPVLLATPEKATVDFLYLNLEKFGRKDRAVFEQSYRFQNCEELNKNKIMKFARLFANKKLLSICKLFIQEMCP